MGAVPRSLASLGSTPAPLALMHSLDLSRQQEARLCHAPAVAAQLCGTGLEEAAPGAVFYAGAYSSSTFMASSEQACRLSLPLQLPVGIPHVSKHVPQLEGRKGCTTEGAVFGLGPDNLVPVVFDGGMGRREGASLAAHEQWTVAAGRQCAGRRLETWRHIGTGQLLLAVTLIPSPSIGWPASTCWAVLARLAVRGAGLAPGDTTWRLPAHPLCPSASWARASPQQPGMLPARCCHLPWAGFQLPLPFGACCKHQN